MLIDNTQIVTQTSAINKIPRQPGLMGSLGLFNNEFVGSDAVSFDVRENNFFILEDHLRNAAQKNGTQEVGYDVHTLAIPHFPVEKTIGREKLAGVRAFGTQDQEQTVANAVAEELERQSSYHDLHEEHMLTQAVINGQVSTNWHGTVDFSTEFGVSRPSETLAYTNPGDVLAGLRSAQKKSRDGLYNGGFIQGFIMLCGTDLFDWVVANSDIVRAYELSLAQPNPLFNQIGQIANGYTAFTVGTTTFVLYEYTFTKQDGTTVTPLAADAGLLIPRTNIGRIFYGPESTLGGLGQGAARRYARTYRDPKDRYIEVMSEQNTLPIVEQYGACVDIAYTP